MPGKEVPRSVREYLSMIGSKTSHAKLKASRANAKKASAAKAAPIAQLETAYRAVKSGKLTKTQAAIDPGKCSYYTLKAYVNRREAGDTPEQAAAAPKRRAK